MRRRIWNRKCRIYGQMGIIKMCPTRSKIKFHYGFHSTAHLKAIVDAFGKWTKKYLDMGWDGYLFQVMFHDLAGSRETKVIQMKQEVERIYNPLATRMVRKPNSLSWAGYLPNREGRRRRVARSCHR
jgi:hypothetical protein